MLAKCVLSVLELNWNIGRQIVSLSPYFVHTTAKLMSFLVVERTRTAMKCTKMEKACVRAKRAKTTVCHGKICKFKLPCVMPQKFAIPRNIR